MYFSVSTYMSFSSRKGEFDRCFNRLDRPFEESRPDRPVDLTGAGRPKRFPSLLNVITPCTIIVVVLQLLDVPKTVI